jgi:hypothetical protein
MGSVKRLSAAAATVLLQRSNVRKARMPAEGMNAVCSPMLATRKSAASCKQSTHFLLPKECRKDTGCLEPRSIDALSAGGLAAGERCHGGYPSVDTLSQP